MNVSVVIPTYNYGAYIRRAIDSVRAQTLPVVEILVIDDGSTDDTRQIVESYGSAVKYIRQANSGVATARNQGIQKASSPWVAFLDADDWWLPHKLERQAQALQQAPNASLVYSPVWYLEPDGTKSPSHIEEADRIWPTLRYRNTVATSSVVVKKTALVSVGGFDVSLTHCEDWDLWVRLRRLFEFTCVREPLSVYRVTPTSLTVDIDRMLNNSARILDKTLLDGLSGWQRRLWRRKIKSAQLYGAAITAREAGNVREGGLLWCSLCEWPMPWFVPNRWLDVARYVLEQRYRVLSNSVSRLKRLFRLELSKAAQDDALLSGEQ